MGGSQSYSVGSCIHICGGAIKLYVTSAAEDAWYVLRIHGGWLVRTMEDDQHPTCVTTECRLHMEPAVFNLGLGAGGAPG